MLDGFEGAYCCLLQNDSPEEAARNSVTREKTVVLLGKAGTGRKQRALRRMFSELLVAVASF